jgi:hypothetical protein
MPAPKEYVQRGNDAQTSVSCNRKSYTVASATDFDHALEEFEPFSWTPSTSGVLSCKLIDDTGADRLIPCIAGARYYDRIASITGASSTCGAVILFSGE